MLVGHKTSQVLDAVSFGLSLGETPLHLLSRPPQLGVASLNKLSLGDQKGSNMAPSWTNSVSIHFGLKLHQEEALRSPWWSRG